MRPSSKINSDQNDKTSDGTIEQPTLKGKLHSFYRSRDKLPKFIEIDIKDEDEPIKGQSFQDYYINLQIVLKDTYQERVFAAHQTLSKYESVTGDKKPIQPEVIFDQLDDDHPAANRILILGAAGIGKTTLMDYMAYRWSIDQEVSDQDGNKKKPLWPDKFDYVFRINLKKLSGWRCTDDRFRINPLAYFIYINIEGDITFQEINEALKEHSDKVLFLVDGYDEVANQVTEIGSDAKKIFDRIFKYPNIIMTSRPNAIDDNKKQELGFGRIIENIGFTVADVEKYVDHNFQSNPELATELKSFLIANSDVRSICTTPINAVMLCWIWQDEEARTKFKSDFNINSLYHEVIVRLGKRYLKKKDDPCYKHGKLKDIDDSEIWQTKEIKLLQDLAYESFISVEDLVIEDKFIKKFTEKGKYGISMHHVERYGLLKTEESNSFKRQLANLIEVLRVLEDTKKLNDKEKDLIKNIFREQFAVSSYGDLINGLSNINDESHLALKNKLQTDGIKNLLKQVSKKIKDLPDTTLLEKFNPSKTLVKDYSFIHLTFQEYLVACCLQERLASTDPKQFKEAAEFIANHRNEPKYLMTLKFLAAMAAATDNELLVTRFWEAVTCNIDGIIELGLEQKIALMMHLLGQAKRDGEIDSRIPNVQRMIDVIDQVIIEDDGGMEKWSEEIIYSGYISQKMLEMMNCVISYEVQEATISQKDEKEEIEEEADKIIEKDQKTYKIEGVVAILSVLVNNTFKTQVVDRNELMDKSLKLLKHKEWKIRKKAIEIILILLGSVISKVDQDKKLELDKIKIAILDALVQEIKNDKNKDTINAICKILEQNADKIGLIKQDFEKLTGLLKDKNVDNRSLAANIIKKIIQITNGLVFVEEIRDGLLDLFSLPKITTFGESLRDKSKDLPKITKIFDISESDPEFAEKIAKDPNFFRRVAGFMRDILWDDELMDYDKAIEVITKTIKCVNNSELAKEVAEDLLQLWQYELYYWRYEFLNIKALLEITKIANNSALAKEVAKKLLDSLDSKKSDNQPLIIESLPELLKIANNPELEEKVANRLLDILEVGNPGAVIQMSPRIIETDIGILEKLEGEIEEILKSNDLDIKSFKTPLEVIKIANNPEVSEKIANVMIIYLKNINRIDAIDPIVEILKFGNNKAFTDVIYRSKEPALLERLPIILELVYKEQRFHLPHVLIFLRHSKFELRTIVISHITELTLMLEQPLNQEQSPSKTEIINIIISILSYASDIRQEANKDDNFKTCQEAKKLLKTLPIILLRQIIQTFNLDQRPDKSESPIFDDCALNHINDNFNIIFTSGIEAKLFLKKLYNLILGQQSKTLMTEDKRNFILNCLRYQFTSSFNFDEQTIIFEGKSYRLMAISSQVQELEFLVKAALDIRFEILQLSSSSAEELQRLQYRDHEPLFPNSGSAIKIAASDIPEVNSLIDQDILLTHDSYQLSLVTLANRFDTPPKPIKQFLFLEQRNIFGHYIAYQLIINEEVKVYKKHPQDLTTDFREEIFGKMVYKEGEIPAYYSTSLELDYQQGLKLLSLNFCEADGDVSNLLKTSLILMEEQSQNLGLNLNWEEYLEYEETEMLSKLEILSLNDREEQDYYRDEESYMVKKQMHQIQNILNQIQTDVNKQCQLNEEERKMLAVIKQDPYKSMLYHILQERIYYSFIAAKCASTIFVAIKKGTLAATARTIKVAWRIINKASPMHIPFIGVVPIASAEILRQLDKKRQKELVKHFAEVVDDVDEMQKLATIIAINLASTLDHSQTKQVIKELHNILKHALYESKRSAKKTLHSGKSKVSSILGKNDAKDQDSQREEMLSEVEDKQENDEQKKDCQELADLIVYNMSNGKLYERIKDKRDLDCKANIIVQFVVDSSKGQVVLTSKSLKTHLIAIAPEDPTETVVTSRIKRSRVSELQAVFHFRFGRKRNTDAQRDRDSDSGTIIEEIDSGSGKPSTRVSSLSHFRFGRKRNTDATAQKDRDSDSGTIIEEIDSGSSKPSTIVSSLRKILPHGQNKR